MYKKQNVNIIELILNSKRVNNYTKLMIYLNILNYYEDYYIPNKKIMNKLNINKKRSICLLKKLEEDRIISIFYKGRKRYFTFIAKTEEKNILNNDPVVDYNWLEEE